MDSTGFAPVQAAPTAWVTYTARRDTVPLGDAEATEGENRMTATPIHTSTGQDWEHLKNMVIAARTALGMKDRVQLAKAMGCQRRVVDDLEHMRRTNFEPATLAALEQALGWDTGSVALILAGGKPIRPTDSDVVDDLELMAQLIVTSQELPAGVKRRVLRQLAQHQREQRRLMSDWIKLLPRRDSIPDEV